MGTIMASAVSVRNPSVYTLPTPVKSNPKTLISGFSRWNPHLGFTPFTSWTGLKRVGTSISQHHSRKVRKRESRGCKGVHASLFGVGAPEALVIGVVALLVFGPKGLAEVARNLGKTLRAFQPTIRELQDVSREFRSSLEREIGLDEVRNQTQSTYSNITRTTSAPPPPPPASAPDDPNGAPSQTKAYSSEEYLKVTEEQLRVAAAKQEEPVAPSDAQTQPQEAENLARGDDVPVDQKNPQV